MVDAFSLEALRDNRKNTLAVDPDKGKTGKKAVFSSRCGDETTTYYRKDPYKNTAQITTTRTAGGLVFRPLHAHNR